MIFFTLVSVFTDLFFILLNGFLSVEHRIFSVHYIFNICHSCDSFTIIEYYLWPGLRKQGISKHKFCIIFKLKSNVTLYLLAKTFRTYSKIHKELYKPYGSCLSYKGTKKCTFFKHVYFVQICPVFAGPVTFWLNPVIDFKKEFILNIEFFTERFNDLLTAGYFALL